MVALVWTDQEGSRLAVPAESVDGLSTRQLAFQHLELVHERPGDGVPMTEAAHILGCSISTVRTYVASGRLVSAGRYARNALVRADVEELACEVYRWRQHLGDSDPYWVTGWRAAQVLGVGTARLSSLSKRSLLPYLLHHEGVRLFRHQQLAMLARDARWH